MFSSITIFHLDILLQFIVEKYYTQELNCVLFISQSRTSINIAQPVVIVNVDELDNIEDRMISAMSFGCQLVIFNNDHPDVMIVLFERILKMHYHGYNERKFIIAPCNDVTSVLKLDALDHVPNVLMIIPKNDKIPPLEKTTYELTTHRFGGYSGYKDPIILDYWISEEQRLQWENNLFPDKISDMNGRIVTFTTLTYAPACYIDETFVDGFEWIMFLEYVKRLNASVKGINTDKEKWGNAFDNGTGNGILGNIIMGKADIGFAAIYQWAKPFQFMDYSITTMKTSCTCLSPKARISTSFLTPFLPFTKNVWYGLGICLLLFSVGYYLVFNINFHAGSSDNKNCTVSEAILVIVGVLLEQPFPGAVRYATISVRNLLIWILIFILVMSCAYSSRLASILTIPRYEKSVKTIQDLIDFNIHWGFISDIWSASITSTSVPKMKKVLKNYRIHPAKEIIRRLKARKFAFPVEVTPFNYYMNVDILTPDVIEGLQLMQEEVYSDYYVFILRKNTFHLRKFNRLMGEIISAGLISSIYNTMSQKYLNGTIQQAIRSAAQGNANDDGTPIKLQMAHLQGVFYLWALGLITATFIFVVECTYRRTSLGNFKAFLQKCGFKT